MRLGRDEFVAPEDPPDRRPRGHRLEASAEMVDDRRRASVVAGGGELGPDGHDRGFQPWAGSGASRSAAAGRARAA